MCSANPITVTPIWKWQFANEKHPIGRLYWTFIEKFLFKFQFLHKRFQMGQKMYFFQFYKLQRRSSTIPISVCKWEITPFLLQSILGYIFYLFPFMCNLLELLRFGVRVNQYEGSYEISFLTFTDSNVKMELHRYILWKRVCTQNLKIESR